jgi:hypothetical protein
MAEEEGAHGAEVHKAEHWIRKHWIWIVGGVVIVGGILFLRRGSGSSSTGSSGTLTNSTAPSVTGLSATPPNVNVYLPGGGLATSSGTGTTTATGTGTGSGSGTGTSGGGTGSGSGGSSAPSGNGSGNPTTGKTSGVNPGGTETHTIQPGWTGSIFGAVANPSQANAMAAKGYTLYYKNPSTGLMAPVPYQGPGNRWMLGLPKTGKPVTIYYAKTQTVA